MSALPRRLADDVRGELAKAGAPPAAAALAEIAGAWARAVGPAVAANAWPAGLGRDGTLRVHVAGSTWAFELSQRGEDLRARLSEALGAPAPPLRFVVGPIPEPDAERGTGPDLAPPRPTEDERAAADRLAAALADPALRVLAARAAAASLAARRGRPGAAGGPGTLGGTGIP